MYLKARKVVHGWSANNYITEWNLPYNTKQYMSVRSTETNIFITVIFMPQIFLIKLTVQDELTLLSVPAYFVCFVNLLVFL